jgi:DNA-binding FadR family transcriptional regulator
MRNTFKKSGNRVPQRRSLSPAHPRSANLTFRLVEDLGIAIVTEQYSKANPFPVETMLCQQYGVSRSILREAVKMLTAKGLLDARPRQGTWVLPEERWNLLDPDVLRWLLERKLSLKLLTEFNEMRLAVEPIAAGLAAQVATEADIAAIYAQIERMAAAERGEDDPLTSDIGFHISIMHATGNRFYFQLCDLINTALQFSIRTTNAYKGVDLGSVLDHSRVADAIAAHDSKTAEAAMRTMMQEALDLIRTGSAANAVRDRGSDPQAGT